MVLFFQEAVCMGLPAAMVGAWLWYRWIVRIKFFHLAEKCLLHGLVIVEVVERPKHPFRAIAQYDPHSLRQFALDRFQHLPVCTKLDEVVGLDRMRQLGVTDFVKWAFAVWASEEKISETDERDQFETRLINDVVASVYGFERDSPRFGNVPARHPEDFLARALQVLEVIGLVLFPCAGYQLLLGRFFVRLHPVGEFQVK